MANNTNTHINMKEYIQILKLSNICMVCIDFDKTLVDIHTHSKWSEGLVDLHKHIRPVFITLIPELIKANILVAIVSFSSQQKLIENLLEYTFPVVKLNHNIFVRAETPIFDQYVSKTNSIKDICKINPQIQLDQVLLIDDSCSNINISKCDGIKAIEFKCYESQVELILLNDILQQNWN